MCTQPKEQSDQDQHFIEENFSFIPYPSGGINVDPVITKREYNLGK